MLEHFIATLSSEARLMYKLEDENLFFLLTLSTNQFKSFSNFLRFQFLPVFEEIVLRVGLSLTTKVAERSMVTSRFEAPQN